MTHRCTLPGCSREAVNPHRDSLCRTHHPGYETDPSTDSDAATDGRLSDFETADADTEPGRDADDDEIEPEPEPEPQPGDPTPDPDADAEPADESEVEADPDPEAVGAHLFMGAEASPYAAEDDQATDSTASIQGIAPGPSVASPVSALPLGQLDALAPHERRRAARKRGLDWPTTDEARERLEESIFEVLRHEDHKVIDAPTSLGKTHTVAATRWGARDDVTGDRPVIHLLETRDARDDAVEIAEAHGGQFMILESRTEACAVAAGHYDPPEDDEDTDYEPITIEGEPASEWLDAMCDGRGIPFSAAHRHLEEYNDQGRDLPCGGSEDCAAIQQWDRYRNGDHPLVIATHNFAYAPGVRMENNLVVDEEPDFDQELSTDRVRRAVGAYLRHIDAQVQTWEAFIQLARYEGYGDDAANERDALDADLDVEPDREWYFEHEDAHILAPALTRAIFNAEQRANGRRVGKTVYEPPRLDARARDEDSWNREWDSVVLDEHNDVRTVRVVPDFSAARSVVGLDAHPALPKWQANTVPWIQADRVLEPEERQLWRRYERGLRVVQVGDATRPLTGGEYFDYDGVRALVEQLVDRYGGDTVRTAITAQSVEDELATILEQAGAIAPETMHYGEEKSRNDFADEMVGLVNGCIDPGDDAILDTLAELDLEASPVYVDCRHCAGTGACDGECQLAKCSPDDEQCGACNGSGEQREKGRTFEGPDADAAAEILASVREAHVAQAAGRYARNADDPTDHATVFIRTDAVPPGFVDLQVPGVEWVYGTKQRRIVEVLTEADRFLTLREIADEADCSKEHVRQTLKRFMIDPEAEAEADTLSPLQARPIRRREGGPHGATLYAADGLPTTGVVDLGREPANPPVWTVYTYGLAIRDPAETRKDEPDRERVGTAAGPTERDWQDVLDPPG